MPVPNIIILVERRNALRNIGDPLKIDFETPSVTSFQFNSPLWDFYKSSILNRSISLTGAIAFLKRALLKSSKLYIVVVIYR